MSQEDNFFLIFKKSTIWIVSGICFLLGFLISRFISTFTYFSFEKDLNIVDIASLIINIISLIATVFLTIYIASVLDKRKQDNRGTKDIILKKIETVEADICRLEIQLEGKTVDHFFITSYCKNLRGAIGRISHACEIMRYSINADYITITTECIDEIRDLLTGPQHREPNPDFGGQAEVTQNDNIISFKSTVASLLSGEISKIKQQLFDLQMEVNNI